MSLTEAVLLILCVGTLAVSVLLYGQLKQVKASGRLESSDIQEQLQQVQGKVDGITESMIESSGQRIDLYGRQVVERLDAYLLEEQAKMRRWVRAIGERAVDAPRAIELAESGLNQFPSSREIFDALVGLLDPLTRSDNWTVRKGAIERMNRAIRIFLDNCAVEDWDGAHRLLEVNLKAGNTLVQAADAQRSGGLEAQLAKLEQKLEEVQAKPKLTDEDLEQLQLADESIDKRWLETRPMLKARYDRAAQALIRRLRASDGPEGDPQREYSLMAVRSIGQAYEWFGVHEKTVKKGLDLETLAERLGGWDTRYLSTPAQVYYQSVYSEIFSQLNPDVKPSFTELILRMPSKKVG